MIKIGDKIRVINTSGSLRFLTKYLHEGVEGEVVEIRDRTEIGVRIYNPSCFVYVAETELERMEG